MEHWLSIGLTLLLLIFGAGKTLGYFQERSELRDWNEWRREMESWRDRYVDATDERFAEASERMSKLASCVNAMPMQIEDRVEQRIIGRALAEAKFAALERRITMLEERWPDRRRESRDQRS